MSRATIKEERQKEREREKMKLDLFSIREGLGMLRQALTSSRAEFERLIEHIPSLEGAVRKSEQALDAKEKAFRVRFPPSPPPQKKRGKNREMYLELLAEFKRRGLSTAKLEGKGDERHE